jgi:hypothetical protein
MSTDWFSQILNVIGQIIELADRRGWSVLFTAIGVYFAVRYVRLWFRERELRLKNYHTLSRIDVLAHPIWARASRFIHIDLPSMAIPDKFKFAIALFMMRVYIESIINALQVIVRTDFRGRTDDQILQFTLEKLQSGMDGAYAQMSAEKVPERAIYALRQARTTDVQVQFAQITQMFAFIESPDADLKVFHVLNIMAYAIEHITNEVEDIFNRMNGDLDGATFKGFTYKHVKEEH